MSIMVKVADYIESNLPVLHTLMKMRAVPLSFMNQYKIYMYYESLPESDAKMNRYEHTAISLRVSEKTVRNAVREMQKIL